MTNATGLRLTSTCIAQLLSGLVGVAALLVVFLIAASPASAVTLLDTDGNPLFVSWTSHMQVASWQGNLPVSPNGQTACPWNVPACAGVISANGTTGVLYWTFGSPDLDRVTLYHELGHLFDARYFTDADRQAVLPWLRQGTGLALTGPWFNTRATTHEEEEGSPAEYFADAYAGCAEGDRNDYNPQLCQYIDTVGAAQGADPPWVPATVLVRVMAVHRSGPALRSIAFQARFSQGDATASATAAGPAGRVRLTIRSLSSTAVSVSGTLPAPGIWTVTVTCKPLDGWLAPTPATFKVRVAGSRR